MMRKICLWAVLGCPLVLVGTHPVVCQRITISVEKFHGYFQDLRGNGHSVNPVERFLFSVILATSNSTPAPRN